MKQTARNRISHTSRTRRHQLPPRHRLALVRRAAPASRWVAYLDRVRRWVIDTPARLNAPRSPRSRRRARPRRPRFLRAGSRRGRGGGGGASRPGEGRAALEPSRPRRRRCDRRRGHLWPRPRGGDPVRPPESRPRVVVLERDPSTAARRQGYGVTLSETNAALAGLGILDELRARNTRSCAHWTFHSPAASSDITAPPSFPPSDARRRPGPTFACPETKCARRSSRGSNPAPFASARAPWATRNDLAARTASADTSTFASRQSERTRPSAEARADPRRERMPTTPRPKRNRNSSETIRASLLVAADGVRSRVQRQRLPDANLNYLGVVLVTGFTTLRHPLMRGQGFTPSTGNARASSPCRSKPATPRPPRTNGALRNLR